MVFAHVPIVDRGLHEVHENIFGNLLNHRRGFLELSRINSFLRILVEIPNDALDASGFLNEFRFGRAQCLDILRIWKSVKDFFEQADIGCQARFCRIEPTLSRSKYCFSRSRQSAFAV